MSWAHLPKAGGLYDQHPALLDAWDVIFAERARHEKAKRDKEKREGKKDSRPRGRGRPRRRR